MKSYRNTQVYKLGKKFERFGLLLQNPKSDITKLTTLSRELNLNISFSISDKDDVGSVTTAQAEPQ